MKTRTVLITGGAGGLGRAMARALLADGHRVAAMDRDEAALRRMTEEMGEASTKAPGAGAGDALLAVRGDVAIEADCNRAVEETRAAFGGLEILVNNAGIGPSHLRPDAESNHPSIEELTPEIWERYFGINVRGAIQMTRAALPSMRAAGWGRIVNNTTSFFTMLRILPYGATKAALESLSAVWAKELEGTGITVNVLVPGGPTDTAFIAAESGIPRANMLQPEVMAAPMRWLAGEDSDGFNGNRIIAADWNPSLLPNQARGKASAPIGWPQLTANVVWPDDDGEAD